MFNRKLKKWKIIGICLLFTLLLKSNTKIFSYSEELNSENTLTKSISIDTTTESRYSQVLADWLSQSVTLNQYDSYVIAPFPTQSEVNSIALEESQGYHSPVISLTKGEEYTNIIEIKTAGLYAIKLDYYSDSNSALMNTISLKINDEYQFYEAKEMELARVIKSAGYPFDKDRYGNEIVPESTPISTWQSQYLRSLTQGTTDCLYFYLPEGTSKLTFTVEQGSCYIGDIAVTYKEQVPTYQEYLSNHPTKDTTGDNLIIIEAEKVDYKNQTTPRALSTRDVESYPYTSNKYLMSTFGGNSWDENGQAIYYDVEVPKTGWYYLSFKAKQSDKNNTNVYRTITIDGKLPFEEGEQMVFPYSRDWKTTTLANEHENFSIYLEEGIHTLGVEVDATMYSESISKITSASDRISDISLLIKKIIGNDTDVYRDWEMLSYIPSLQTDLYEIADELEIVYNQIVNINLGVKNNQQLTTLKIAIKQLRKLAEAPDEIPNHMTMLSEGSGSVSQMLGDIKDGLMKQPLRLDQIYFWQDNTKLPDYKVSWFTKLIEEVKYFISSFGKDDIEQAEKDAVVLKIWVNRARNYVDLLQKMTDADFTKKTGIKVEFSIMPNEQKLILANTTNTQPDVGLGISSYLPFNLALRGAIADLRQFDDFSSVAKQFSKGSLLPYTFEDGIYALPETQDFYVLYYRKDLLETLEIPIPNTWEEVVEILPELQRFGMNFYIPLASSGSFKTWSMTLPFIYQFGGSLYSEDGSRVILNSEEGLNAMQFMTDLFKIYGLPSGVGNFYQQFRSGNLTIGVDSFATYLKLDAAAAELAGAWDIAPMPGVVNEDGVIERWSTGAGTSATIFEKSKQQKEAWDFMKWWLSDEVQTEFGTQLELLYGNEYIWNTANLNAFKNMPIEESHKEVILEQWEWLSEVAYTPASYMVEREISNVWNKVVLDGENTRSALDDAVVDMNRELIRKLEEFGYAKNGKVIKKYKVPSIERIESLVEYDEE